MSAGHAQRIHEADPEHRRVAICDKRGKIRWHPLWEGNPILVRPEDADGSELRIQNGSNCRPYIEYPFTIETGLTCTSWRARDHLGKLYLTAPEKTLGWAIQQTYGPFVVVEPSPNRRNPNKRWVWDRWIALIETCRDVRFVQLEHPDSTPLPGAILIPTGGFRAACGVLNAAAAYVGTEGGLHHAAAVLDVPAVVLFGGYISPETTGYPTHINLYDDSPGSPCGRWTPCAHCVTAMQRITVEMVVAGLRSILPVVEDGAARPHR